MVQWYAQRGHGYVAAGILALQLNSGPPAKAQFKDIRLKKLDPK